MSTKFCKVVLQLYRSLTTQPVPFCYCSRLRNNLMFFSFICAHEFANMFQIYSIHFVFKCTVLYSDIFNQKYHSYCITASGSESHQLLAAWRKGGNHQTSQNNGGAPSNNGGAPPLFWVLSTTNKHSSTSPNLPPSYLPATSADPPSPPIPRSGGDHTPLHPLLTWNPPLRPRGLGTVF